MNHPVLAKNKAALEATRHAEKDANLDPLTGAAGAHPVGTGIGAAAGGMAAGAAVGTIAGPVGTVIGAALGAVAGGLAGKGVAELIDPTYEDSYWRENYTGQPYVSQSASYDDYGPAYRYGVDGYMQYPGGSFDDAEQELSRNWPTARGTSSLDWGDARNAARDSWRRVGDAVERAVPGDSDRDGK